MFYHINFEFMSIVTFLRKKINDRIYMRTRQRRAIYNTEQTYSFNQIHNTRISGTKLHNDLLPRFLKIS